MRSGAMAPMAQRLVAREVGQVGVGPRGRALASRPSYSLSPPGKAVLSRMWWTNPSWIKIAHGQRNRL
jgi:hypothetical protein